MMPSTPTGSFLSSIVKRIELLAGCAAHRKAHVAVERIASSCNLRLGALHVRPRGILRERDQARLRRKEALPCESDAVGVLAHALDDLGGKVERLVTGS